MKRTLLHSNRFALIVIGITFALGLVAIVALNPGVEEFAKWIGGFVEVLIGYGLKVDTDRRMGAPVSQD
tara:strand:+ start:8333 stop:8539 length:207 start_codon:yes stop_codon:yes gene_type:complete